MTDDIRAMSEMLATDPSSLVFVQLGEALRRKGQLELAHRVATRGLERHPQRADAHDLVARIAVDLGDFARARAEWESVLAIAPGHGAAQKGLGFLFFQQGDLDGAARYLAAALAAAPDDRSLATALDTVKAAVAGHEVRSRSTVAMSARTSHGVEAPAPPFAPAPTDARALFKDILSDASQAALLLDADGLVVAGNYLAADGTDLGADIGAQLSGVSDEAARAVKHLNLGAWRQIAFEADTASVAMAPGGTGGVLLVSAPRSVPLGFVRRLLERSLERAKRWLESGT